MTKKRYIQPTSDPFVADVRLAIKKLELKRKPLLLTTFDDVGFKEALAESEIEYTIYCRGMIDGAKQQLAKILEQEKVESQLNHGLPPLGSSWHEYPEWFRVAYNDLRSQEYSGGGSQ